MPLYDYKCSSCGCLFEGVYSISEMKKPEGKPCPECNEISVKKVIVSGGNLVSGVNMNKKIPDGWNDVLKRVKSGHPGSTIETK
jgi:putative FmdB family regulatory protein